jgi:hypothetical protein
MSKHIFQLKPFSVHVECSEIKQQLTPLIFLFVTETEARMAGRRKEVKKE